MFRVGLTTLLTGLGIEVVAATDEARDGIRRAGCPEVELLVLGAHTDLRPADAVQRVKRGDAPPQVVSVLRWPHWDVHDLLAVGADALVDSATSEEQFATAVDAVLDGRRFVAPTLIPALSGSVHRAQAPDRPRLLTSRELDVLECLARGYSNREIAHALYVSVETVKSHLSNIYAKLEVKSRRDALARAATVGLLS